MKWFDKMILNYCKLVHLVDRSPPVAVWVEM